MQTNKPNVRHGFIVAFNACVNAICSSSAKIPIAVRSLLWLVLLAGSAQAAQTVRIVASPIGVTLPLNYTGSAVITNAIHIGGGSNAVNFAVSGLPSGATYSFDVSSLTADGTNFLTLNFANVPEGLYNVSIDASGGATGNVYFLLQVGVMWNGSPQVSGNWSSSSSWVGGTVPGASDDVLFTDLGAQTNLFTNSIVNGNFTIGSLRFMNVTNDFHVLQIPAGNTLSVLGTNGFTFLLNNVNLNPDGMTIDFVGGGNLVVSNQNANFTLLIENQQDHTLDMATLANFTAYVNRMGLGDYSMYPNYYNYVTNQYTNTAPRRFIPTIFLARTNVIKTLFTDPNGFTNLTERDYGICFDNSYSQGSTVHRNFNLGYSNVFYADSICINHGNEGGNLQFNPGFARATNIVGSVTNFITNSLYAVFRNTNGGRMSVFTIGDDLTPGAAVSNIKGAADFTGGTLDLLVDKIYVCRDPAIIASNQTPNVQGQLYMSRGIADVNSLFLGYQQFTNRYTNPPTEFRGYCEGTLVVSNTANFIVHGAVTLGYTTDTDPNSDPGQNFGRIIVGPGGTMSANQIVVDGGANLSSGNVIAITNAALIVSNTIASSTKKLDTLGMNGGTLTLFINGANSTPYVYATNFNTAGFGAGTPQINIGSITGLATPAQVQLVQYNAGTPTVVLGSLPGGYSGTLINNGPGSTIDVYLSTAAPKILAWRGYVNNNWDNTTKNWLDLNTGLQTNFATLDHVIFDDTAGVPTNINLAVSGLTPGAVNMTNSTLNYTIAGANTIIGSTTMFKTGTGSLDIEGNTTLSVEVNQGLLFGSGTINAASVDSGGKMLFSGTIRANVVCAGQGTSSGSIAGGVNVQSGGAFTNLHTVNGPITLDPGSFMNNSGTVTFPLGYTSTVGSNAVLLNLGTMSGDLLQVNGTLQDQTSSGTGLTMTQVLIASGGTFIPGNGSISGTTYVKSNGNGNTPGRLTLSSGSTTIIEVNPGQSPANTTVWPTYLDYGPSQNTQSQNGGTLVLTNIDGHSFAAGQSFNIFGNALFNLDAPGVTGTSTNSYPIISPVSPGPGLSWNFNQLWPNGIIGVMTTPVVHLTNSFALISGTNVVATFSWPAAVPGYTLETQENPLSVGLSSNWSRVPGTWTNTQIVLTNSLLTTNPVVFFRLVYP